jgi:uncharacterized repeat protein (TIGR02543 family)
MKMKKDYTAFPCKGKGLRITGEVGMIKKRLGLLLIAAAAFVTAGGGLPAMHGADHVYADSEKRLIGRESLSGELAVCLYDYLAEKIRAVAMGGISSTEFTFTFEDIGVSKNTFTRAELGIPESTPAREIDFPAAHKKMLSLLGFTPETDINKVVKALQLDYPFETFWFDSTYSMGFAYSLPGIALKGGNFTFTGNALIKMAVCAEYSSSGAVGTYSADTNAMAARAAFIQNADAIIAEAENEGLSDFEKLKRYKDRICELVTYDFDALGGGVNYGDPWQLISVFDGNPFTNVVCEGYSKAFRYLVANSSFDADIECRIATGIMTDRYNSGSHMWNIVSVDGKNYHVDVTNSDEGMSGQYGALFMVGCDGQNTGDDGRITDYTININSYNILNYRYDEKTRSYMSLYADDKVVISDEDYKEKDEFTITFDANGGKKAPAAMKKTRGKALEIAFADSALPVRDGYFIIGWSEEADATDPEYTVVAPFEFTKNADVTLYAVWQENPFEDCIRTAWHKRYIGYVYYRGTMTGHSGTEFGHAAGLLRCEMITLLWKLEGKPAVSDAVSPFEDVHPKNYYLPSVIWGKENGITTGKDPLHFDPLSGITRQEFVVMLYRYAGNFKNYDVTVADKNAYLAKEDAADVASWARTAVNWGYINGFIGNGSNLEPKKEISRAEAATIMARFINKYSPIAA